MAAEAGLQVHYLPLAAARASARWEGVLGIALFGLTRARPIDGLATDIPLASVSTPVLVEAGGESCEIWRTDEQLVSGRHSNVHYRRGADVLFGCISLPESDGLHVATATAYREIFAAVDALGFPHLLRVWNYLPQINLHTQGIERYWQFNSARRDTLIATARDVTGNVPAACALGSADGSPLVIYFLASRTAPAVIENPRQISAYDYPPQYGPKPVFSRASLRCADSGTTLFISGTASIVGHRTMHVGDAAAQTRETLVNIEALLEEANRVSDRLHARARFDMASLAYKVYVRNPVDLPLIQFQLQAALGPGAPILYLQAD